MDRVTLDKLELIDQVEFFNDQLEKGKSLTKICDEIGITRKAVRVRFEKGGYTFDKDLNLYKLIDLNIGLAAKQTNKPNKKLSKNITNTTNTNQLETRMKALETKVKALEELINNNSINTINTNDKEVNITTFEGETVSRAYRLDAKVQKDFKIFCKKHSEYKVQDIISSALQDFMDKNK